jgi:hypothetical protein
VDEAVEALLAEDLVFVPATCLITSEAEGEEPATETEEPADDPAFDDTAVERTLLLTLGDDSGA